jgi:hypothetical protein
MKQVPSTTSGQARRSTFGYAQDDKIDGMIFRLTTLEQSPEGEEELPAARVADGAAQRDGSDWSCGQHTQHSILSQK